MGNGRWDRRIGMEYGVIFDLDGTLLVQSGLHWKVGIRQSAIMVCHLKKALGMN